MTDNVDAESVEHFGYEVEYLTATGSNGTGTTSAGVKTCAHPSARDYDIDTTGIGERAPTLRLQDENGEEIAAYSPLSWLAVRKLARAANPPADSRGRTVL